MKSIELFAIDVLNRLGINHREIQCRSGVLYICSNNGYTFDMKCDNNGVIKLWKFIGTAPFIMAGKQYEYNTEHAYVIGIEITEDGDMSFYAQQKYDMSNINSKSQIENMIRRYIKKISDPSLHLLCKQVVNCDSRKN